ncbi:MAG: ATP-binding protein [Lachnospiraceae bacterium]|nr:ATP-binding protein [Lachnospiraceae bacterium]
MALSNTQYDTLIRRYEARQIENQHIAMERISSVYGRFPRLGEIDEAISSISVAHAKKLIDGDDTAFIHLKEELSLLIEEKHALLKSHGYPENYFEPPYHCPDCKDTGYIGQEKCHCFKQAAIDLIYTQSNIRQILEKENFQNFSYEYYSDSLVNPSTGLTSLATAQQAVALCMDFISTFDVEFKNLFFYGDTGIGKTYLSNCVAKELLDSGHSVIYFTASSLFHIFEKNTFGRGKEYHEDYQNIFDCNLLIIDDLGTELSNTFTTSQLFTCLNERILRRKSTIISTNLSLGQFVEIYSERTFSRISSNYTMIKLFGNDIRIQKKLGQNSRPNSIGT